MKKIFFLFIILLSYSLTSNMEIIDKQSMINYMHNAKQAEKDKNLQKAFQWYGKAADVNLPPSPNNEEINLSENYEVIKNPFVKKEDPYVVQRKCRDQAFNKIAQKAYDLKAQGKFEEALVIYQCAPQSFPNQITALQMLLFYQKNKK